MVLYGSERERDGLTFRTEVAIRIRRTMAMDDKTEIIITAVMRTAAAWR